MNKNDFLLVSDYRSENPRGWWMSEKLDGIRAIWDGYNFISREGNVLPVPEGFKEGMPSTVLDGELYAGHGGFQKMLSLIRKKIPRESEWDGVGFYVFDAPSYAGDFEERQAFLKTLMLPFNVNIVKQIKCAEQMHLDQFTAILEVAGAEGWVIRKPHSNYEQGRTSTALKFKFKQDAEAVVFGYYHSENQAVIASLVCEFNGNLIHIGNLPGEVRIDPPKIGSKITFSFYGLTDYGSPRHASFVAERNYE